MPPDVVGDTSPGAIDLVVDLIVSDKLLDPGLHQELLSVGGSDKVGCCNVSWDFVVSSHVPWKIGSEAWCIAGSVEICVWNLSCCSCSGIW